MSEYEYYEFQAVDRPLTPEQMAELRAYSTRARITQTSFINFYTWGSFKGDPRGWMERYFDAFLYLTAAGFRSLMLRVPRRLLDRKVAALYCSRENPICRVVGEHLILSFDSEQDPDGWDDGDGWLASLTPLRSDLIDGDYRCLYLGWLLAVEQGMLDDDVEPPVPAGLATLTGPLTSFAEFLRIDPDLITAAAEGSGPAPESHVSKEDLTQWVAGLPSKDKDAVLVRLFEGADPHLAVELRRRAQHEILGKQDNREAPRNTGRRSVTKLLSRAEAIRRERQAREAEARRREEAERERIWAEQRRAHLESLVGTESHLWTVVERLIATKQPQRYDEAVALLADLRDLADMRGEGSLFAERARALSQEHAKKPSFLRRLREAGLPD
jgi:hypothetical protein